MIETLPPGWTRLVMRAKVIGSYSEAETAAYMVDHSVGRAPFTDRVWKKFQILRYGMYTEGAGTWNEVEYVVEPPDTFSIKYNCDKDPQFESAPSRLEFERELRRFPRSESNIPDWFRRGLNSPN